MRGDPICIKEYEETTVSLTSGQQRQLRALAGNNMSILPGDDDRSWRIRATSYVGTVVTPYLRLLIKPKVSTANLFHLLEAGGEPLALGPELFDYEATGDIIPAVATFFARHAEACLGRGIARQYQATEDRLSAIKGRVDLRGQLQLAGLPLPIACQFDEYTADTGLNRLVKGAALRLARLPRVTLSTRRALLQALARLHEVGPLRTDDYQTPTIFNRLNEHYRVVERLSRMVLVRSSLLDATGTTAAAAFLVDMNKVFEEFVEARLRQYLRGRLTVCGQVPMKLDALGDVGIRPDLVFMAAGKERVYVADSKYKITADGFGREADYYQLLAYTTALDLPEGMLIYCQHDGSVPPREVLVGPEEKRLVTLALRLDRSIASVEHELRSLAQHVANRAVMSRSSSGASIG